MIFLVIDDSKLARLNIIKSIKTYLEDVNVLECTNGKEALEILEDKRVDVAFLDLTMPIMDGYEALPLIIEKQADIKVVVVSADVQPKAKAKVIELGAKIHTSKPITEEKMKKILRELDE